MNYDQVRDLACGKFRRFAGVKKETFNKIVGILRGENRRKKTNQYLENHLKDNIGVVGFATFKKR